MNNLSLSEDSFIDKASEFEEIIKKIDDGFYFVGLVEVVAVNGLYVDVKPLSLLKTTEGTILDANTIYSVPFLRLQSSNMALIIDPSVGDKGLVAICDRDVSLIKQTKQASSTPTRRRHSLSDSMYLGAIAGLNGGPSHYIKIAKGLIEVVSEDAVKIVAKTATIDSDSVTINANTKINGDLEITGNSLINGVATVGGLNFKTENGQMPVIKGNWLIEGNWDIKGELAVNGVKFSTHVHTYSSEGGETDTGEAKNA